ncbi:MAG TPA: hypothetical protein VIU11_26855 [Nakamurella sp.]
MTANPCLGHVRDHPGGIDVNWRQATGSVDSRDFPDGSVTWKL